MTQTKIKADLSGLDDLLKKLGKGNYVKIGILGSNASTKHKVAETLITKKGKGKAIRFAGKGEQGITNAELGLIHELGSITRNIPPRSFLRMPIEKNKNKIIQFLSTNSIKELISEGNYKKVLQRLGIVAEGFVQQAFETKGFGQWDENSPATIKMKGSSSPLIDTSQLRKAITSKVVTK